ncbi:hypothetical protein [Methylobacterium segetis]|nr:hypothetical protein [Methylobacterium segetis]
MNALIPGLPKILQSCASPGFYRSASTDTEINDALQAMFVQATAVARLTQ